MTTDEATNSNTWILATGQDASEQRLSLALKRPIIASTEQIPGADILYFEDEVLCFQRGRGPLTYQADFLSPAMEQKIRSAAVAPLRKAIMGRSKKMPHVLDATAGLARDSWLLAVSGFEVLALEKNPILHALTSNALERALAVQAIEGRLEIRQMDTMKYLAYAPAEETEVIYLDPMFPDKSYRGQVRKEAQLLQHLAGKADDNTGELLSLARQKASNRVVVKRPIKAAPLDGQTANYEIAGKTVRYDVYLRKQPPTAAS